MTCEPITLDDDELTVRPKVILSKEHLASMRKIADESKQHVQHIGATTQWKLFAICVEAFIAITQDNLVDAAVQLTKGINQTFFVRETTPYLFYATDRAVRIIPHDNRRILKAIHDELARVPPAGRGDMAPYYLMAKASAAAIIGCEKGAIHITRENLGYALKRLRDIKPNENRRAARIWTESTLSALRRSANSRYQLP